MAQGIERQLLTLIATDRIDVPVSSMSGKLKRQKKALVKALNMPEEGFFGDRVYARVTEEEGSKARGMTYAIDTFCRKHPNYGAELRGLVAEQRVTREPTMYFGMHEGCRLTSDDYINVMTELGFTENAAEGMYQELMTASRKISRSRDNAERKILIG